MRSASPASLFPGCLEDVGLSGRVANCNHEDAVARRIEAARLEVELEATQIVEGEISKVRAARGDEVLLVGREEKDFVLVVQLAQMVKRRA
jgi:hypothetical protein